MTQFLIISGSLVIIFGLMMLSLKFGKYKERKSECCGGGHCETPKQEDDSCCGRHRH